MYLNIRRWPKSSWASSSLTNWLLHSTATVLAFCSTTFWLAHLTNLWQVCFHVVVGTFLHACLLFTLAHLVLSFLEALHVVWLNLPCLSCVPCVLLVTKDLECYWDNNLDLAEDLRSYWGDSEASMRKVFPLRFYGDGAETTGLNSFELMSMISVAPLHSSTMKTRFVLLGDHIGYALYVGLVNFFWGLVVGSVFVFNAFLMLLHWSMSSVEQEPNFYVLCLTSRLYGFKSFCFCPCWPRLSIRNSQYTSDCDRTKLLRIFVWSFTALCILALHLYCVCCHVYGFSWRPFPTTLSVCV